MKDNKIRIVAFADSHGSKEALKIVVEAMDGANYVMFAGDGLSDVEHTLRELLGDRLVAVKGNCDDMPSRPGSELKNVGGVNVLLTHGHTYQVEYGLNELAGYCKAIGVRLVIFGHTHVAGIWNIDGVTLVNPGSIPKPKGIAPSYAEIIIEDGKITPHIKYLSQE